MPDRPFPQTCPSCVSDALVGRAGGPGAGPDAWAESRSRLLCAEAGESEAQKALNQKLLMVLIATNSAQRVHGLQPRLERPFSLFLHIRGRMTTRRAPGPDGVTTEAWKALSDGPPMCWYLVYELPDGRRQSLAPLPRCRDLLPHQLSRFVKAGQVADLADGVRFALIRSYERVILRIVASLDGAIAFDVLRPVEVLRYLGRMGTPLPLRVAWLRAQQAATFTPRVAGVEVLDAPLQRGHRQGGSGTRSYWNRLLASHISASDVPWRVAGGGFRWDETEEMQWWCVHRFGGGQSRSRRELGGADGRHDAGCAREIGQARHEPQTR